MLTLTTNITTNAQARTASPKGAEGIYITYDEELGLTKVGRTANLEHDYRACTRFLAEGICISITPTNDITVSKDIELLCKEAFIGSNRRKHSGAQGETYRIDGNKIVEWLKSL